MSGSCFDDVSITTGNTFVRSSLRIAASTSSPLIFGSFMSSSTTLGSWLPTRLANAPRANRKSSASTPSRAICRRLVRLFFFSARTVSSASDELSSTSSTSTSSTVTMDSPSRQREVERRPLIGSGIGPDPPPMALENPLHQRQPHPRSLELVGRVQPLEHAEQLAGERRVEPHPVVPHQVDEVAVLLRGRDLDPGLRPRARILERVADQVRPHLPQQPRVPPRRRQGPDVDRRAGGPLRRLAPQIVRRRARERTHVDLRLHQLLAAQPGKLEQVVDQ